MGLVDRFQDALTTESSDDANDAESVVEGPAAAGGVTSDQQPKSAEPGPSGEVSSAGSGADGVETSTGGADGVPDTPDGVAADFT